jgi:hypothetical protein
MLEKNQKRPDDRHPAGFDKTQEGHELRRAIRAGFSRARFWLWVPRLRLRFELVVHTLSVVAVILMMLSLFRRGTVAWTENFILYAVSPLCFFYLVREHFAMLMPKWDSPIGKVVYAFGASLAVTVSKVIADQYIRSLSHVNPSIFPDAQLLLTSLCILVIGSCLIIIYLGTAMLLIYLRN